MTTFFKQILIISCDIQLCTHAQTAEYRKKLLIYSEELYKEHTNIFLIFAIGYDLFP